MENDKYTDFLKVASVINSCMLPVHALVALKMIEVFAAKHSLTADHRMVKQLKVLLTFKTSPNQVKNHYLAPSLPFSPEATFNKMPIASNLQFIENLTG
jgi:hypothetical protein